MPRLLAPEGMKPALLEALRQVAAVRQLQGDRRQEERHTMAASFLGFLPYWQFVNRDTGEVLAFGDPQTGELALWEGQQHFADHMVEHPWIYALKAGKLGFTELECAYDAWVLLFLGQNARVHLFSLSGRASQELLKIVRFGLDHLPRWLRPQYLIDEAGGKTSTSLRFRVAEDDERTLVSYAATPDVSIDMVCHHAHVDELARMPFARATFAAIYSTVAPEGSCHVLTRGKGEGGYAAELWRTSMAGTHRLVPFFTPWSGRPDRDLAWYKDREAELLRQDLHHFAPATPEDALAGDDQSEYLPIELWDRCRDTALEALMPGSREIAVLGVDAGIKNDCTGIVLVTRHPQQHENVAVRGVRLWRPEGGNEVDLDEVESFIKAVCLGGCAAGHYKEDRLRTLEPAFTAACGACHPDGGEFAAVPPYSIYEVAYDPWQMENSAQRLRALGINMQPFDQGKARAIADSEFRDLVVNRRIAHDGNELLRSHVSNAAAVLDREEHKLRVVKKSPAKKVDLLVAAVEATNRCLALYL